jgi:hypothetical protein
MKQIVFLGPDEGGIDPGQSWLNRASHRGGIRADDQMTILTTTTTTATN